MPIDPARQRQAKEYARLSHRLLALEVALTLLALVAVIALGLNIWLKQTILTFTGNPSSDSGLGIWLATFLYFAARAFPK
jgi:uncharacterized RDD family membrane protein YckC